jgi:hypothetical protein
MVQFSSFKEETPWLGFFGWYWKEFAGDESFRF